MAFSNMEEQGDVMSEINMVPLIDIMLVLLIIFIITVPVIKHAVNVDLPQVSTEKEKVEPETISLSIASNGDYFLDTTLIADTDLELKLTEEAKKEPQPSLHISGDKNVRYERVALAMAMAQRTGLSKIGFVTEPETAGGDSSTAAEGGSRHGRRGGGPEEEGRSGRRGGGPEEDGRRGGGGEHRGGMQPSAAAN
ncbi:Biopolymer transport protein ExbD [Lampropedia hyalina DSM 16112]|uniref:Biopolymer transport protein ExbD n=1 Tax=Lampropedia hyalina DSM 16112 TaxID=1122156 RepID=A0A1M4XGY1_9BURK|nr:Biopolymer transport protein ExbD [Lampropedia hyalina DSM 16112]